MDDFKYMPLYSGDEPLSNDFIRLFEIKAEKEDKLAEGNLRRVSFEKAPNYEALSYTWGNPQDTIPILVNDCRLRITKNLMSALVHLRRPDGPRLLWVDAICINQADNDEKTSQVSIMKKIYEKSTRTLIWLGDATEDSALGLSLIPLLLNVQNRRPDLNDGQLANLENWTNIDLPLPSDHIWEALISIFKSPYWERIWIVQEVVVPQTIAIMCGPLEVKFDDLYHATIFIHQAISTHIGTSYESMHQLGLIRNHYRQGKWLPLSYLLPQFRISQATDARDKVFALLGIATGIYDIGDLHLLPDYNLSTREVYIRVSEALVHGTQQLGCLKWACGDSIQSSDVKDNLALPSWVPDWSESDPKIIPIGYSDKQPFSAGGNSIYTPQFPELNGTLTVEGQVFDEIVDMGQPFNRNLTYLIPILKNWQDLATRQTQYATSGFGTEFFRTVLSDTNATGYRATDADIDRLLSLLTYIKDMIVTNTTPIVLGTSELQSTEHCLEVACNERTMVLTQRGYMGLVPYVAKTGDKICLLKGGRVPFILRSANQLEWRVVGHCYLHGIMYGEAFKEEECVDIRLI